MTIVLVTTLAGSSTSGAIDGLATGAMFNGPLGMAVNSAGSLLYVTDRGNHVTRTIVVQSFQSAAPTYAPIFIPSDVPTFKPSLLPTYVPSTPTLTPTCIPSYNPTTEGLVTTSYGTKRTSGSIDGIGTLAKFNVTFDLALSSTGTVLYVSDVYNNEIQSIVLATGT